MGSGKDGQVVGYEYYLGVDFAWCHGPVDRCTEMLVDNKPLGVALSDVNPVLAVSQRDLFGEAEGGIEGRINLLSGASTQVQMPYLVSKIGADVPAYRGVTRTVLNGSGRSFYVGNNPYLKKWSGEFQRIYKRVVDGEIVDNWQPTLAGVPLIEDNSRLIEVSLNDQTLFIQVDLSSAANGYSGVNGDITGGGQDIEAVKSKVINTLLYIRDTAFYQKNGTGLYERYTDFLGQLYDTLLTGGLSIGVGYFRYTDGAANNTSNTGSFSSRPSYIANAPIPTEAQKVNNTYNANYNFPKRGVMMFENAFESQIDQLIEFVREFRVVPDNVPTGERSLIGLMDANLTDAYAAINTTDPRSNIVFSTLDNDMSVFSYSTLGTNMNSILDNSTSDPIKTLFHSGPLGTTDQEFGANILVYPSDVADLTITGGWTQIAQDPGPLGPYQFQTTASTEFDTATAEVALFVPSGDIATTPFGIPPDNALTWYFGPLITGGIYAGRYNPQIAYARSSGGPTTVDLGGLTLDQAIVDISEHTSFTGYNDRQADATIGQLFRNLDGVVAAEYVEMNPAHIIRECLTDKNWGLGLAEADVDETTFLAAAQTLYDERFGISLAWFKQEPIEDFVNVILNHIDAVLYVSRDTGKWILKLIRDDYDVNTLPDYTDADVVAYDNISIKAPADLTNSLTINYNSRELRGSASLTVNNLAQIQQLGQVINTTVNYAGIWQPKLATRVAQRDLISLSTALIAGEIAVTRKGFDLNPGDVFKLTSSRYGLSSQVMRVVEVSLGDGVNNQINVKFVQDKFNISTSTDFDIVQVVNTPNSLTNYPEPIDDRVVIETPHWIFSRLITDAEAATREAAEANLGFVSYTGIPPTQDATKAIPYIDDGTGYREYSPNMSFSPYATLDGAIDEYADTTTLTLTGLTYGDDISQYDLLMIDDEIMKVVNILSLTEMVVGRGCLDTVPRYHATGSKVYFISSGITTNLSAEYVASDEIDVKLLTLTSKGALDPALAPTDTLVFDSRITRPYAVGKLQLDGLYNTVWDTTSGATLEATWVHRDRLVNTGPNPVDFTDASVGPEAGVNYVITAVAYDLLGVELAGDLFSVDKVQTLAHTIASDAYSPTTEGTAPWSAVGVRVTNTRDTYTNWQTPEVLAFYPVTPTETESLLIGFWADVNDLTSVFDGTDKLTQVAIDGDAIGLIENQRN